MRSIKGVIFSDLGHASSFMTLDWVQEGLQECLGFTPFPATLNVRPKAPEDARVWQAVRSQSRGILLPLADGGFCSARLYPVEIHGPAGSSGNKIKGAILLPDVTNYPTDKIEIVAPIRLKEAFGVQDGEHLTLELVFE
jgi:riboflavin kinase